MPYRPTVNSKVVFNGREYRFTEHPAAKGMPYGQTGRRATVYQVRNGSAFHALKVFTKIFRTEQTDASAQRIQAYANLPGLQVCSRVVITRQNNGSVIGEYPDLEYAVLMPWVEGQTWQEIVLSKQPLTTKQGLNLAQNFVSVLANMEQNKLAHCDLSGPNLMVAGLLGNNGNQPLTALVDVEDLHAPELAKPAKLPAGTPGYNHRTASAGLWCAEADRFAGAVLFAEILAWCDERVRRIAAGEQYFDPLEMQQGSDRFNLLKDVLEKRFGHLYSEALTQAWFSQSLNDCPRLADWQAIMGNSNLSSSQPEVHKPVELTDAARYLFDSFKTKITENNFSEAEKLVNAMRALMPDFDEPVQILEQAHRNADQERLKREELASLENELVERQTTIQSLRAEIETLQAELNNHEQLLNELAQKISLLGGEKQPPAISKQERTPPPPLPPSAIPVLPSIGRKTAKLVLRESFGHTRFMGYVPVEDGLFLADGKRFITFAGDKKARVWGFDKNGSELLEEIRLNSAPRFAARHEGNHWVALGDENGWVTIWETSKKLKEVTSFEMANEVTALAFSPSGNQIVASCTGSIPSVFSMETLSFETATTIVDDDDVDALEFSPNGKYLICGTSNGTLYLLSTFDFSLAAITKGFPNPSIVFDSQSRFICCGDGNGMITLFDIPNLTTLHSFSPIDAGIINRIAIASDNELIASSTDNGTVYLWRTGDGKLLDTVNEHAASVFGLDFHPSGKYLLSSSYDGRAILWAIK